MTMRIILRQQKRDWKMKGSKKIWLLLFSVAMSYGTWAQIPGGGGGRPGGGSFGGGGGQASNIGHFYGRIVDAKTDKGMDGVSVQLIQSKFDTVSRKRRDTVIAG